MPNVDAVVGTKFEISYFCDPYGNAAKETKTFYSDNEMTALEWAKDYASQYEEFGPVEIVGIE